MKIPTRRRKIWSRNWESKSRRRRNVVEKSQSEKRSTQSTSDTSDDRSHWKVV